MKDQSFNTTIVVKQSPREVFDAINNVRAWWSQHIEGRTDEPNSEFIYRDKYLRARMKIIQLSIQQIIWEVIESHNTFFGAYYEKEWDRTKITFDIS